MGGIPCKPLLENFLFPEFCMAMEIVIKCSADEFSPKKSCFEKQRKFGLDTLQTFIWKSSFGANELQSLIWSRHVEFL